MRRQCNGVKHATEAWDHNRKVVVVGERRDREEA